MSGHKRATITITRDEYDHLREAREGLRILPDIPVPFLDHITQQRSGAIENSIRELEQRHEAFQQVLRSLDKNVRQIEKANADSLLNLQTNTYRLIQQHSGQLWDRVEALIEEQTKRFHAAIAANQSQNQEALHQLSMEIERISRVEEMKQAAAQDWLSSSAEFYNFLQANYACEFFLPGEMEKLYWQIDMASQNYENGYYDAVLSSLQQLHFQMSELRVELEKQTNQWQMLFIDTWETAVQILTQAEQSMDIPAIDLHGEPLPYTIHVDAWAENRLAQLVQDISGFVHLLENQGTSFPMDTLSAHRNQTLPAFVDELEDILAVARVNAINAQLRVNIADFVIQALREQGFAPNRAGYENDDAQGPYQVVFRNYEGSEVVVEIRPAGRKIGQNELDVQSFDPVRRSEDELEDRWDAISHSLARKGVSVGPFVREDGAASPRTDHLPRGGSRGGQRNIRGGRTVTTHGS